jgi:hypothetical protein
MLLRSAFASTLVFLSVAAPQASAGFHANGTAVDPCTAKQLSSATVNETLNVQTQGLANPQFSAVTDITVPDTWPDASALTADPTSSAFHEAIGCFLPIDQTDYRPRPLNVSIAEGKTAVHDEVDLSLDPLHQTDVNIGLWTLSENPGNVRLALVNLPSDSPQAHWTVTINTGGAVPSSWTGPLNRDDAGQKLYWSAVRLKAAKELAVSLAWPGRLNFDHRISSWPEKLIAEAGWNLGAILFFVMAFFFLQRIRGTGPRDARINWFFRDASRIALLGLASELICVLDDYELGQPTFGWLDRPIREIFYGNYPFSEADAFANAEFLVLIAFSAVLCYLAWRGRLHRALLSISIISLVLAAGILQLYPPSWGGLSAPLYEVGNNQVDVAVNDPVKYFIISSLPLLITCLLLFFAVIGYTLRLWPVRLWPADRRLEPRIADGPPRIARPQVALAIALLLGLGTVGMVMFSSRGNWVSDSVLGNSNSTDLSNWLVLDLLGSFHWLLQEVPGLLFWPVVASLFGGLWFRSQKDNGTFFMDRRISVAILALIYAGVYIGIWGEDFIFDIPIAFVSAYLLLSRVAVTARLEQVEKKIHFEGKVPAVSFGQRLKACQLIFFQAAQRRKQLETELSSMHRGGQITSESNRKSDRREEIEEEIRSSLTRWESNPTSSGAAPKPFWRKLRLLRSGKARGADFTVVLLGPERIDPAQVALAVGPTESWWENGWRCVFIGAPVAVFPAGYYIYENWAWPIDVRVGFIDAVQQISGTLVSWLLICFVYGSLQPYIRGGSAPIRGIVVGLVALASFALDAMPTYLLNGPHYSRFLLDGLVSICFTVILAVLVDIETLRKNDVGLTRLFDFYQLSTVRVGAAYALTIVIALIGLWQQAHVGDQLAQQRAQISNSIVSDLRSQLGKTGNP